MSVFLYCCIQHYVPKPLKNFTFLTLATYQISNYKFQNWMYVNLKFFFLKRSLGDKDDVFYFMRNASRPFVLDDMVEYLILMLW